jgi:hypothetical protein
MLKLKNTAFPFFSVIKKKNKQIEIKHKLKGISLNRIPFMMAPMIEVMPDSRPVKHRQIIIMRGMAPNSNKLNETSFFFIPDIWVLVNIISIPQFFLFV